MAKTFMPVDREQRFLLPPDMREWLPEDHVVWFLIEVVEQLDLSALEANYRLGAQGRRAYHPAMLLTVLLYAYSQGQRSSRKIEAACRSDVAYRVICGSWGETPDHSTICRFRRRHEEVVKDLFCQVLVALHRLGMLPLGVIAVDGTKVEADAALSANRTVVAIREEVEEILAEAEAVDADEGDRFGERRGDELPDELVDPRSRAARLRAALEYAREVSSGHDDSGATRVNTTDPDSRPMHSTDGYLQGYNAQVAVGDGQVVQACAVTNRRNDAGLFSPMLAAVTANLEAAGVEGRPSVALGDAGYFDSDDLAELLDDPDGPDVLVATTKRGAQPEEPPENPEDAHLAEQAAVETDHRAEQERRGAVFERVAADDIDIKQAQHELGLSQAGTYAGYAAWRRGGIDAIPAPRRRARIKRPPKSKVVRAQMEAKLAEPANKKRYKARAHLVEGFFAAHKHQRNGRWFARRGLRAVNAELTFDCLTHNLLKMRTAITTATRLLSAGFIPTPA